MTERIFYSLEEVGNKSTVEATYLYDNFGLGPDSITNHNFDSINELVEHYLQKIIWGRCLDFVHQHLIGETDVDDFIYKFDKMFCRNDKVSDSILVDDMSLNYSVCYNVEVRINGIVNKLRISYTHNEKLIQSHIDSCFELIYSMPDMQEYKSEIQKVEESIRNEEILELFHIL